MRARCGARPGAATRPAVAALIAAALIASGLATAGLMAASARAADDEPLTGRWVLKPLDLTLGNGLACTYRQTIDIRKRGADGRYAGTAVYRYDCDGRALGDRQVTITIRVDGDRLRIGSPDPQWIDETLKRVSPRRLEGADAVYKHRLIYERPKAKPLS